MNVDQLAPQIRAAWTEAWRLAWWARVAHTQIDPLAPRVSAVGWYHHIHSPWSLYIRAPA